MPESGTPGVPESGTLFVEGAIKKVVPWVGFFRLLRYNSSESIPSQGDVRVPVPGYLDVATSSYQRNAV